MGDMYVNAIDSFGKDKIYDVALVDGRFRIACALKLIYSNYINRNSVVMFHDYDRIGYHYIETFYDVITNASRLVVLKPKNNINKSALETAFDKYIGNAV